MSPETFAAIADNAPFRYSLSYENFGVNYPFGVIRDEQKQPLAVLRERSSGHDLAGGLSQYRLLGKYGIAATQCLPYIHPNGQKMVLSQYIDGPEWDDAPDSVSPERTLAHALNLGKYYISRVLDGEPVLYDILQPFQYKVQSGRPVLIDTDLYVNPQPGADLLNRALQDIPCFYQPMLPHTWHYDLYDTLENMAQQYGQNAQLQLRPLSPTTG